MLFSAAYAVARPMITYGAAKSIALTGNKLAEQVAAESAAAVTEIFTAFNDALNLGVRAFTTESALYSRVRRQDHGQCNQCDVGAGRQVSPC